jgi:hypothetical protein
MEDGQGEETHPLSNQDQGRNRNGQTEEGPKGWEAELLRKNRDADYEKWMEMEIRDKLELASREPPEGAKAAKIEEGAEDLGAEEH